MENIKFLGAQNEVQKIYSDLGLIVPVGDLSTGKSPVVQVLPATSTTDSITATFNVISNAEISALSYVVNEGEPVTVTPQTGAVTISLTELEKNSGPYTITLTAVNENGSTDSTTHVALQPYTDWAEPESVLAGNKFIADGVEMVGEIETKDSTYLTVNERTVTVPAGYYAENASASVSRDYIIPTGSTSITTNGSDINIAQYATVNVAVPNGTETLNATTNNTYYPTSPNIGFSEVVVNVPGPTGTLPITQNGTGIDVTNYAAVDVAVPMPTPVNTVTLRYNSSGYDFYKRVSGTTYQRCNWKVTALIEDFNPIVLNTTKLTFDSVILYLNFVDFDQTNSLISFNGINCTYEVIDNKIVFTGYYYDGNTTTLPEWCSEYSVSGNNIADFLYYSVDPDDPDFPDGVYDLMVHFAFDSSDGTPTCA